MKIAINRCYGGFNLSPLAVQRLAQLKGQECFCFLRGLEGEKKDHFVPIAFEELSRVRMPEWYIVMFSVPNPADYGDRAYDHYLSSHPDLPRNDSMLIQVIEELKEKANGTYSDIQIVDIPDDIEWEIKDYDGIEHVAEVHRIWY
jgi:hypothetical protein